MKLQDMTEDVKLAVIYSRRNPPIRAGGGCAGGQDSIRAIRS